MQTGLFPKVTKTTHQINTYINENVGILSSLETKIKPFLQHVVAGRGDSVVELVVVGAGLHRGASDGL